MNILDLSDDDLKLFLEEGIPENIHRDLYVHNNKFAQKIKGFRPSKAPIAKLSSTSFNLIRKEKNNFIIKYYTNFYSSYKDDLELDIKKMIDEGYPDSVASSIAVKRAFSDKFLPIYFKLENISLDTQSKIIHDYKVLVLIEKILDRKLRQVLEDKNHLIEAVQDMTKKMISDHIQDINKQISELSKNVERNMSSINNIKKNFDENDNHFTRNVTFQSKLSELENRTQEYINSTVDNLANIDLIRLMNERINELNEELNQLKNQTPKEFTHIYVRNDNYETMDDFLTDNIGDVIENLVKGDIFDVFREYLIEIVYSKKPIICSSRNSRFLTSIISSIMSGGNYHIITLNIDASTDKLIDFIEALPSIQGNKVILIKNKINVTDSEYILDYIMSRPVNEKYIFEITYEKEVLFMANEILDRYNFYFANIQEGKIDYNYLYQFDKNQRKSTIVSDYVKSLDEIGLNLKNKTLMNENFYGVFAFSIIPFLSIHNSVEKSELVDKLTTHSIRAKCEATFNE
ncbi:hypothetical protein BN85305300 [Paracholeplasma brassicae]|uniref:Uncharacterized protein n=1 Tax=Acholeplasma brassicae TaxID=61635 RepID=U4KMY8_9MOLU|nr:hypothetical protein [Paracholeplasma brassicae]CCV65551.1 hypothetical protein BN85305300 [Paracholeplasma brassicae]